MSARVISDTAECMLDNDSHLGRGYAMMLGVSDMPFIATERESTVLKSIPLLSPSISSL